MSIADPAWSRTAPARAARAALLGGVFGPLVRAYARVEVAGAAHVDAIDGPAVIVANHSSHVDTPILLRALPAPRRRRTAVAAAADYFYATRALGAAVSLCFGTIPVKRGGEGSGGSLAALETLVADGWSVVLFAEGTRSRDGRLGHLRTGAAVLSARQGIPIVPVQIAGSSAVMPPGRAWMMRPQRSWRRHSISVRFGPPVRALAGSEREAMERVSAFLRGDAHGAQWSLGSVVGPGGEPGGGSAGEPGGGSAGEPGGGRPPARPVAPGPPERG